MTVNYQRHTMEVTAPLPDGDSISYDEVLMTYEHDGAEVSEEEHDAILGAAGLKIKKHVTRHVARKGNVKTEYGYAVIIDA